MAAFAVSRHLSGSIQHPAQRTARPKAVAPSPQPSIQTAVRPADIVCIVPEAYKNYEAIYREVFYKTLAANQKATPQITVADQVSVISADQPLASSQPKSKSKIAKFRQAVLAVISQNAAKRNESVLSELKERLPGQDLRSVKNRLEKRLRSLIGVLLGWGKPAVDVTASQTPIQASAALPAQTNAQAAVVSHPIKLDTVTKRRTPIRLTSDSLPVSTTQAKSPVQQVPSTQASRSDSVLTTRASNQFYVQPNGNNLCGVAAINAFLQAEKGEVLTPENLFGFLRWDQFYLCNVGMFSNTVLQKIEEGQLVTREEFCAAPNNDKDCLNQIFYLMHFLSEKDFLTLKTEGTRDRLQEMLGVIWQRLSHGQNQQSMKLSHEQCLEVCVSSLGGLPIDSVSGLLKNLLPNAPGLRQDPKTVFLSHDSDVPSGSSLVKQLGDRFIIGTGVHYYTVIKSGNQWLKLDSLNVSRKGFQACNNVFASSDEELARKLDGMKSNKNSPALIHV